jgi:F-type H+-transporting ATPase subunit delta
MAAESVFAPKYANAFANVAASAGLDVNAAQQQMRDFAETLSGSVELREVLMDPSVPADQKLNVVDALAERMGLMREVRNFVAVIIDHQRLGEFNEIVNEYHRVAEAGSGIVDVSIVSARALNPDDRQDLEQQAARRAGSRIRVQYTEDAALLGGAVVTIGSTVYDGSVRGQLQQMKRALMSA